MGARISPCTCTGDQRWSGANGEQRCFDVRGVGVPEIWGFSTWQLLLYYAALQHAVLLRVQVGTGAAPRFRVCGLSCGLSCVLLYDSWSVVSATFVPPAVLALYLT